MQGTDTTMAPGPQSSANPRTTAAGLEAWLSGVHAEPEAVAEATPEPAVEAAGAEPEIAEVGPVNAAEALVLDAFTGARKLKGPDGAELVVDLERGAYHFESTSLKPLAALLQQPADQWIPIYSEALKTVREAHPAQPLERLRWYAGLVATPGILGRKLPQGGHYKLARWPETEREFPKHFRIATAMLKEPASADAIAAAAGVSNEEAIDYINASHASGRLETAPGSAQAPAQTADSAPRKGGLRAKLNKPLFAR